MRLHIAMRLGFFLLLTTVAVANVNAASLAVKVQDLDDALRSGPTEAAVGAATHLLVHQRDRADLLGSDGTRRSIDYSEVMYASKNLVKGPDGKLRFAGLDGDSGCRIFVIDKVPSPVKSAPLEKCAAVELFGTRDGLVAWVQEDGGSHRLDFLQDGSAKLRKAALPGSGLFVTSVVSTKGRLFAAMQLPTPDGAVDIVGLSLPSYAVVAKSSVPGTGATLAATADFLVVAVNRKEGRSLIGFDMALGKKWETPILKNVGIGSSAQLLIEGSRIYYVSGNDNKLYAAVFDMEGKKLGEVMDAERRQPLPLGGYAASVDKGTVKAVGLVENQGQVPRWLTYTMRLP